MGACNSKPAATESSAAKAQDTLLIKAKAKASTPVTATQEAANSSSASTKTGISEMSSESDNTAKTKKGWSKTAKGAVIGGVVGAGTGAVVNKKNRGVGAVVGGAAGAGVGAIIGNEMDKKDRRH